MVYKRCFVIELEDRLDHEDKYGRVTVMCTWSLQTGGWESVPVCSEEPRGAAEMGGDSAEQHQVGQLLRGIWVRPLRHRQCLLNPRACKS